VQSLHTFFFKNQTIEWKLQKPMFSAIAKIHLVATTTIINVHLGQRHQNPTTSPVDKLILVVNITFILPFLILCRNSVIKE